jgi:hypothetical protein
MGCWEWEGDCGAIAIPSSGLDKHVEVRTETGSGDDEEQGHGGGRLKIQDGGEEGTGGKDYQDRTPRRLWLAAWEALSHSVSGSQSVSGSNPGSSLPNLFDSDADTDPDTDACGKGRPGGYAGVQTSSQKESATRAGVGSS